MRPLFALVSVVLVVAGCSASAPPVDTQKNAAAKTETSNKPAGGLPPDHPYAHELAAFVAPSVCKLFGPGWSGDGQIIIKNGKVELFEAGTTSIDPNDPQKSVWDGQKAPDLVGKDAPPIPKDLAPVFDDAVWFDVGCM